MTIQEYIIGSMIGGAVFAIAVGFMVTVGVKLACLLFKRTGV